MAYDPATGQVVLVAGYMYCGCLAQTWIWQGGWRVAPQPRAPLEGGLSGSTFVYDAATRQLVLFDSQALVNGRAQPMGATWTWDGRRWTQAPGRQPDPADAGAAYMVYDSARRQVVLFESVTHADPATHQTTYRGETWTWDGRTWALRPGAGPGYRSQPSIAYDDASGQVVLVGGDSIDNQAGSYGRQTWIWKGSWSRAPMELPARRESVLIYDPATRQLLLFGGAGANGLYLGDTWTWNGRAWTQRRSGLGVGQGPAPRILASAAYDPATRQVVVFGGKNVNGLLSDTWAWTPSPTSTGAFWQRIGGAHPTPRTGAALAYSGLAKGMVLFGGDGIDSAAAGSGGGYTSGETWTLGPHGWAQRSGPGDLVDAKMAYDAATGQVLMTGLFDPSFSPPCAGPPACGNSAKSTSVSWMQTWAWNGARWSPQPGLEPPARTNMSLAYDPATKQLVLFGGAIGSGNAARPAGDTWTWSPRGWSRASTAGPSPRENANVVYDAATRQLVLFGGDTWQTTDYTSTQGVLTTLSDTWTWNGTSWTCRAGCSGPDTGPGPRVAASLAYYPPGRQLVLFGGRPLCHNLDCGEGITLGDTWTWSGSSWTQRGQLSLTGPAARSDANLVYDPNSKRLVLHGGEGSFGGQGGTSGNLTLLGDTWAWDGATWRELASSGPKRMQANAFYHDASKELVLVGGYCDATSPTFGGVAEPISPLSGDTWVWNGQSWRLAGSATGAANVQSQLATYDPANGRAVLYGPGRQTWAW